MKNRLLLIPGIFALAVILVSWGAVGHTKISQSAGDFFNPEMDQFRVWIDFLADHSSDADYRKNSDPEEGPKHYIDIDNYHEFKSTGRIPQTLDSAVALYGIAFVKDAGILPWATLRTIDTLTNCMMRGDWEKARFTAADLGHYVGDGHMPLHITSNYNGQQTGNDGIHSRYESNMISNYVSQIVYPSGDPVYIRDMNNFVFEYLYRNNKYVDSILLADNYARSLNANTSSFTYKQALWDKTKGFTIPLFKNASQVLASMIYTSWINAGKPLMQVTGTHPDQPAGNVVLYPNAPNPFSEGTGIRFTLKEDSKVLLQVRDLNGYVVATLADEWMQAGEHSTRFAPARLPAGMYYLVLNTGHSILINKMICTGK